MRRDLRASLAGLAMLACSVSCLAQLADVDPDWEEQEVPPPPALQTSRLIPLDMPGSELRFGVDPDSIMLGADGVVRYVVIARSSSGVTNAMYEGVRCNTGEVRTYARLNPDSGWVRLRDSEWKSLHGNAQARHSLTIARTGACLGRSPNRSPSQIARDLREPADKRFEMR